MGDPIADKIIDYERKVYDYFRPPDADQRDQAVTPVENAKQIAEQFIKDFGRLKSA